MSCPIAKSRNNTRDGRTKRRTTVFIADAGCCDVAVLFPECTVQGFTGFCGATMYYDEVWALGQIRLYAAGIQSEIIPGSFDEEKDKYTYTLPEKGSVDVVICGTMWGSECDDIQQLYDLLKPNGTMFWFSDRKGMAGDGKEEVLRKQIVNEKAIHTLVSFEGDFTKEEFKVYYDNGVEVKRLRNEQGNKMRFKTPAGALMYFLSEGWEMYLNGETSKGSSYQGTGSSKTSSYWILRKPCTKEEFEKAVQDAIVK